MTEEGSVKKLAMQVLGGGGALCTDVIESVGVYMYEVTVLAHVGGDHQC